MKRLRRGKMKKQELKIKQELNCQETVDLFSEVGKSISEGVLTIEYGDKKNFSQTRMSFRYHH